MSDDDRRMWEAFKEWGRRQLYTQPYTQPVQQLVAIGGYIYAVPPLHLRFAEAPQ